MKNFVAAGSQLTLTTPNTVASGAGVIIGAVFGIANAFAAAGSQVVLTVTGVFDLPKATGALTEGAVVHWDDTAKGVTTTAAGNTKIGVSVSTVGTGSALARVRLNGTF